MSWILFEPVLCILALWPCIYTKLRLGPDEEELTDVPDDQEIQKDVPGDQKPLEDQEDYEDLSGSRPFAIEYLLGIAC